MVRWVYRGVGTQTATTATKGPQDLNVVCKPEGDSVQCFYEGAGRSVPYLDLGLSTAAAKGPKGQNVKRPRRQDALYALDASGLHSDCYRGRKGPTGPNV